MWSKKVVGGALALLGIAVEASAHSWSMQDALWVGFALVVAGCGVLWFSGSDK